MTIRTITHVAAAGALAGVLLAGVVLFAVPAARADEEMKNLKVFPSSTTKRELTETMKQWSQALGVRCDFCHEQKVPGDFQSIDFASDKIGHKLTARRMLGMVNDLNAGTLPRAAGEEDAAVSCVTCHRGLTNPATLDRVVLRATREAGGEAGVQKYRELRERYYGSGSYDFGPRSLQTVAESLAADPAGLEAALAIGRLNVEMYPNSADPLVVVAQILEMKQDKAGALAAVTEALKLQPDHRHALRLKKTLEQ